ncbi:uncharacterized protein TrAFT101_006699 [Trichoderma asperellum]|uniref:Ubiquitin-like domain-containing protein n=1 Tax=Trichoderma asperellum (strain ATCC 204424 / CBS 433.97 / NBRC 101777) TaxID=1042311 RepID=A0A2T3Z1K4_TRIA4|nr:hypothetical protein M441DRAFT_236820 [Trichoderma asperellum CBS 433.97]PTB38677.1 hypothetical protein M441DRAFT_236820 [Trichoderma asperellum CBS 433.97]UKZ91728.1 hypothetical protein TrAFT101_006699 [Trichoderma asperellum]
MGCCFSRSAGPNSPYPGGVPDASSRAGNPPPLTLPEGILSGGSQTAASVRRRRRDQTHREQPRRERPPLDQHINRPLRKHEWTSAQRRWTRRELAKEREEFFETRVVCRPEIWQTLHAALQVLWEANPEDSQDEDSALATAQTILNAAEISLPTGDLVNGAYDSLGNLYALPEYIVSDPDNLADDNDPDFKGDTSTAEEETAGEEEDDADSEEAERRREEKGKGVLDEREMVTLRARLSETGQDIIVPVTKTDSVRSVVKKITEVSVAPSEKKIRLAYMGKILKENASLEAQGWQVGHVINALVFNR